jgi:hypothetical protein
MTARRENKQGPFLGKKIGKHVPAATNTHAIIVNAGNGVFYSVRAKEL